MHAAPTCIAFDPLGRFIAVGCQDCTFRLLRWGNTHDLGELAVFHVTKKATVATIKLSRNGAYMAVADSDNCVGIFCYSENDAESATVDGMPVDIGKELGQPGPGLEPSDGETRAGGFTLAGMVATRATYAVCTLA